MSKTGVSPLLGACFEGQTECAAALIECGKCDLELADGDGDAPLYAACHHGDPVTVKHLIAAGSQLDHTTRDGNSPLKIACICSHIEVCVRV